VNKRITFDISPDFTLEKKLKGYTVGVDYAIDKTGNYYTILSESLKETLWPNDWSFGHGNESIMIVDRQGLIKKMRFTSFKKNPDKPNKEIMDMIFYGNFEKFIVENQKIQEEKKTKKERLMNDFSKKGVKEIGRMNVVL